MSKEKLKVTGILEVNTWKNGKLIDTWIDKNLVVNSGLDTISSLLGGGTNVTLNKIGFDTYNTAPAPTDTLAFLSFTLTTKAIAAVSYPGTGQVKFDWVLETYEGNGTGTIGEFLLLRSDSPLNSGSLFARRTHPGITKDNTVRLTGSWTLQF